jgi:GGDEF domain-containing protein
MIWDVAMQRAPNPANEIERIASLRRMLLLATPDEEVFDRVIRIAEALFHVPIVLVSLIDEDRQWFKACIGLQTRETGRDISFCGHAIMQDELFIIPDARNDIRFADNPLVTGPPNIIFYAGRPLKNAEGFRVGTLCIIDHEPRELLQKECDYLNDLGSWIEQSFMVRSLSDMRRTVFDKLGEVERNSFLDPTLNIWSKGAVLAILGHEVSRSFENKGNLTVMMISFEFIGKPAADFNTNEIVILIDLCRRLKWRMRCYDTLALGDAGSFIAIFPEMDRSAAQKKAHAIQDDIELTPIILDMEIIELSLRIGSISVNYSSTTPTAEDLLHLARTALQEASKSGIDQLLPHDEAL